MILNHLLICHTEIILGFKTQSQANQAVILIDLNLQSLGNLLI